MVVTMDKNTERTMFYELMNNKAVDANYPISREAQSNDYFQRTFGNKYVCDTKVKKASGWIESFLRFNKKENE